MKSNVMEKVVDSCNSSSIKRKVIVRLNLKQFRMESKRYLGIDNCQSW